MKLCWWYRLKLDDNGFAVILHHLALGILKIQWLRGIFGNENDIESTMLQHTIELAFAGTDGYGTLGVIISDVDSGIFALFVVVVRPLVLVELERSALSCIDIEINQLCWLFVAPFHLRPKWDDGSLADEDGNLLVGGIDHKCLTSFDIVIGIEIVPSALLREIDGAVACLGNGLWQ